MHHISLQEIYLYAKVIGSTGSAAGVIYGAFRWLSATYRQAKKTNENFELLMTNHIPHIQRSIDNHGETIAVLSSDIRNVGTKVDGVEKRLEDTQQGVTVLGVNFLKHLENVSRESAPKKKSRRA